jgi:dolichol-phosphate mannosyltransferase
MVALQAATGADVVTGTRYAPGGGVAGWGARRKLTSRGANLLAQLLLRPGVSDLTGSFRLYKADLLRTLVAATRATGYAWQMEVAVRAVRSGARVAELPITFVDRVYGASKLGGAEVTLFLRGLATLFFTT